MNKAMLMGRVTKDPEIRNTQGSNGNLVIANFSLAVNRPKRNGQDQEADFIRCVVFGKLAEVVEKYVKQGTKLLISGHIQTGTYTDKDGNRRFTTDVVVDDLEFAESKSSQKSNGQQTPAPNGNQPSQQPYQQPYQQQPYQQPAYQQSQQPPFPPQQPPYQQPYQPQGGPAPMPGTGFPSNDGFMNIPDGVDDELPFN